MSHLLLPDPATPARTSHVALASGHPLESEPLGRRWEESIRAGAGAR